MQKNTHKKQLAWLLAATMVLSGIPAQQTQAAKVTKLNNKKITITVGKSKTLKLKNNKKKTTWKIVSGKKCIKLKNKKKNSVKIVALKKGKAKVQVKAGRKKYTCTVTVKAAKKQNKKTTTKAPSAGNTAKATQTPNTTKEPSATGKPAVTRSEWIATVMNTTEFQSQKNLFDYDGDGNVSYSFTDIKNDANADLIETAVKYGIIPDEGGKFRPDDAADREFLAVTSVRAVGFAIEESKSDYYDKADLKYEMEDVVAVQLELVKLSDNRFLPTQAITSAEKQNAVKILSDIVKSHDVDEKHTDVIEYNEEVADEKDVTDYTISEKDGVYTVTTANGTSLDNVSEGDKIILPAVDGYPEGMALIVRSNDTSSDGENRILTGTAPDNITEFVDNMDIEGKADIDGNNVTAVDGVSDVEVSKNDEENTLEKNANGLKQAKIDGEIALQDKTKFCYTIKEIDTTISFYLSELQYRVDFDKKGVNDLYIGLPSVLSMDTNCKANKNFSGKIGEIPINLGEGFTANIEVYLETSISGEITINLTLSNNVGMHYYKGQFYVIKSCEPSFDAVVDADIDAGAKLQLGLYWMKGIKEIFGKTDSRPVYNVNTKWGIHGDATLHIRNDQYTAYENLSCVDLAYYLYGNISVGDGSFLGEQFDLKKTWAVYNAQNSPLKGAWHFENRKRVEACTYNNGTDAPSVTNEPNPTTTPDANDDSAEKNAADVAVLQRIIQAQRQNGASVSENLDSYQYTWENGRLVWIYWRETGLQGELNVSGLTALTVLWCEDNQLSNLDVSGATALKDLYCDNNKLSNLDVSGATALTELKCYENQLSGLDVSKNVALTGLDCRENELSNLDVSGATALTDLWCNDNKLSNLDVSKSTALETLSCVGNQLSNLDVSKNMRLTYLDCGWNKLSNLDVRNNTALETLSCGGNQLSNLDVSKNVALTELDCRENELSGLDVSKNVALTGLDCRENELSSLDVSKNVALTGLSCYNNELSSLDVSKNTALTNLECFSNELSNLDVSKNTALKYLHCNSNKLSNLDVSKNTALEILWCHDNQLSNLDVSKNTALTNLECFSNELSNLDVSKNTALKCLHCDGNKLSNLDVSGATALTELVCDGNKLSNLDVSKNTALEILWCHDNQLSNLDVSKNTALTWLECDDNVTIIGK